MGFGPRASVCTSRVVHPHSTQEKGRQKSALGRVWARLCLRTAPPCKGSWMTEHLLALTAFGVGPPERFHAVLLRENDTTCVACRVHSWCSLQPEPWAQGQWPPQDPPGCLRAGESDLLGTPAARLQCLGNGSGGTRHGGSRQDPAHPTFRGCSFSKFAEMKLHATIGNLVLIKYRFQILIAKVFTNRAVLKCFCNML